ncbi:MAG TPA: GNAT family N-acetyltransferase [Solirubrobacteraceae bacterium]
MSRAVTLPDGGRLVIRPIEPDDRSALVDAFERLSEESRYRRFFGPVPALTDRQLDYLTDVDHHDHEALIAFPEPTGDGDSGAVAVARFVRTDGDVAEPAIAVVDEWQGRGVATVLLDALVARAREENIGYFAAPVLASNTAAITALRRLGTTTITPHGQQVELLIALPAQDGATPPLRHLLRSMAAGTLSPAVAFLHRVALGLRPTGPTAARNTIVVAAPASPDAALPVDLAADLAQASGAAVHVVGVQRLLLESPERLEERLHETADDLRGRGLPVTTELRRGDLAAALLDAAVAGQARLIVVDGTSAERRLGSAWNHVAHHAPCDVLVARGEPAER